MSLRISSIEINRYRGISQKLLIDFHTRGSKKPGSMILAGDNGVGKSSIVDAFEYALQGRRKRPNLTRQFTPLSMSTSTSQECYVRVGFSDGSTITRGISEFQTDQFQKDYLYKNKDDKYITKQGPHPNFTISPFILRRADILRFWTISEGKRQTVFSNYLRKVGTVDHLGVSTNQTTRRKNIGAVRKVIRNANEKITDAFLKISASQSFVKEIEIIQGKKQSNRLSFRVKLCNGMTTHPYHIFSEANLDLLALIIFLVFMKESAQMGQAEFLILDDVLQSVDATIRVHLTDYILDEFKDWQMIFTVHDRLWQEQLRTLFQRKKHQFNEGEIIKWDFDSGPLLLIGTKYIGATLKDSLTRGDINAICAQSGLMIERMSNNLSYTLPISITRRKGDKYTLGDMWPGIVKSLTRTTCKGSVDNVNQWLHLRNLVGAHYNDWAQSLSLNEAQEFGSAVLSLLDEVYCGECYSWVERIPRPGKRHLFWTCRCGHTKVESQ